MRRIANQQRAAPSLRVMAACGASPVQYPISPNGASAKAETWAERGTHVRRTCRHVHRSRGRALAKARERSAPGPGRKASHTAAQSRSFSVDVRSAGPSSAAATRSKKPYSSSISIVLREVIKPPARQAEDIGLGSPHRRRTPCLETASQLASTVSHTDDECTVRTVRGAVDDRTKSYNG